MANIAIALDAAETAARSSGYKELKVKQTEVLINILGGNDVFVALPTGYGKSPMLYVLAKNIYTTFFQY